MDKDDYYKDLKIDERIKILPIYGDKTLIRNFDERSNVIYYVLSNELTLEEIKFYRSFNKKIINIMHDAYLSYIYSNSTEIYQEMEKNKLFDAIISVVPDDYYININLGINNTFFIPNLYPFDASKSCCTNFTFNNIIMLVRENDFIKDGIYGIKTMKIIVNEIPDAKLLFISSDDKIVIKEFNMEKDVVIKSNNQTNYFLFILLFYFVLH